MGINPFLIIAVIVFTLNYLYFKGYRRTVLLKKFEKIPEEQKRRKDILCIVYIASIIVINILFFIYFRSKNIGT